MRRPKDGGEAGRPHSVYLYPEEHLWFLENFMGITPGIRELIKFWKENHKQEEGESN